MTTVHLLVLIHGMWGNPGHLSELARIVRETHGTTTDGTQLRVLLAEANSEDSTYDGIDWGGERVAKEILDEVEKLENQDDKVVRFSVTGYSLGGLLARFVIGVLHQRGFFNDITPVNFNTIATPHIGLPRYPSLLSSVFSSLGPKLLSRTGEQFYCVDKWSATGRPLLEVMADPDRIFYQALASFQHIRIYANGIHDRTVPYVTAAIVTEDPFVEYQTSGIEIVRDEQYTPLVKSYNLPSVPPPREARPVILSPQWFRRHKPGRPLLPPLLQFRFPFNLVVYAMLPLLIPIGISLAVLRLSLATRSSRARIRLLENDETSKEKLINILAEIEQQMEETVVEMVDNPSDTETAVVASGKSISKSPKEQPILTPLQHKIAKSLNQLPIKKEIAFFENVVNSHAIIVCRDVKRFEMHKMGEGLLRHWANSFIL
ncbi:putative serine esterase-domain-containing protein [Infundibulicybe gibba]|nr:putative serine esterase-domain-containing protein [Infundibulicybe gibba]